MSAPNQTSVASSVLSWEKAIQQTKPVRSNGFKKKNSPLILIAVVAMVVLAASGVWRSMHQAAPTKMLKIVVSRGDTAAGIRLGFMNLRYMDIPYEFASKDMLTSLKDVANHVTKTFVPAGEPLTKDMLFQAGQGLSQSLDTDERAITLRLDEDQLVDHEIAPDDLVDVVVVSTKDGQKYAKTVCQAARVVIAATKEQTIARHVGGNYDKITLAVAPDVAEALSEAVEVGKIRLVLRNRLCIRKPALHGTEQKDLLPASAYDVQKTNEKAALASLPQTGLLAPPPPLQGLSFPTLNEATTATTPPANPLEWAVQMFSGSRKETLSVPVQ
jgi:Flp pilus assembly protein CpaB